jgi:hypothetical protein
MIIFATAVSPVSSSGSMSFSNSALRDAGCTGTTSSGPAATTAATIGGAGVIFQNHSPSGARVFQKLSPT